MRVWEIYFSILGESARCGYPAAIVRLAGCNLRCLFCDTTYAYEGGQEYSLPEIISRVRESELSLVLITGGEPLLQAETPRLIKLLLDSGFAVLLETNGSYPISSIDPRATIILDQKCPGSGMSDKMDPANLDRIRDKDEIKFVLSDYRDYCFARERIRRNSLTQRCPVTLSPVHGVLSPQVLAQWIISDRLPVRLGIQLHRYLGVK